MDFGTTKQYILFPTLHGVFTPQQSYWKMGNSSTRKTKGNSSTSGTKSNETRQAPSVELNEEDINNLQIAHEVIAGCVVQWDYFADGGLHEAFFGSQLPTAAHDCELRTLYAVPNHFVVRGFRSRDGKPDIDNLPIAHVELVDVEARSRVGRPNHSNGSRVRLAEFIASLDERLAEQRIAHERIFRRCEQVRRKISVGKV